MMKKRYMALVGIALVILVADQASKIWAQDNLASLRPGQQGEPNLIELEVQEVEGDLPLAAFIDARFRMTSQEDAAALIGRRRVLVNGRHAMGAEQSVVAGDTVLLQERTIEVIPGFFNYKYVENRGAAWGFLSSAEDWWRRPFFVGISMLAMVLLFYMTYKAPGRARVMVGGFGLLMGGTLGNLVDRVRLGYVIDFIDWHLRGLYHWPTFNIADAAITVGVGLLFVDMIINWRRMPEQATAQEGIVQGAGTAGGEAAEQGRPAEGQETGSSAIS